LDDRDAWLAHRKRISLAFDLFGQLKINPQDAQCSFTLRDIMIRAQPMLSQKGFQEKVDGSTRSDYNIFDLAQRNLENSDEDKIIKNYINDLYDKTSLLQEVQNILSCCKQIKDKYESTYIEEFQNIEPISVLVFKNESDIN
jgi:hypothetical protein